MKTKHLSSFAFLVAQFIPSHVFLLSPSMFLYLSQVDELMRQELKNLKLVVDRDKGKKKKKVKKSSKKVNGRHEIRL